MSIESTENMNKFEKIVENLKKALKIKSDKDLAGKLNLKSTAFSERKRTNSIPHNEILELCISENLNINEIYTDKKEEIDYKEEIIKSLENLLENDIKSIYHFTKSKEL